MAFTGSWSCSPIAVKALMISDTSRGARRHGTEYLQNEELKQMLDQMALKPSNPQLPLPAGFVPPCLPTPAALRRSVACTRSSAMASGHRPQGGRAGEAL